MQNRPFLTGLCLIGLFLLSGYLRVQNFEKSPNEPVWSDWSLLLVAPGEDHRQVLSLLENNGIETVSRYNQTIRLQDYGRMKTILLNDYENLLEPLDPRIDPYMRNLDQYFTARDGNGTEWEIFYLFRGDSLVAADQLTRILEDSLITYALPERENHNSLVFSLLGLLFFLFLALTSPAAWKEVLLYSLPWLTALATGDPELLFSNNLAAYGMLLLGREARSLWKHQIEYPVEVPHLLKHFIKTAFPGGFLLAGSLVFLLSSRRAGYTPGLLLGMAAHAFLFSAEMAFLVWRSRRRLHRLFHPLPLVQGGRLFTIPPLGKSALIAVSLILLPLTAALMIREADWQMPLPEAGPRVISWETLAAEWDSSEADQLPGLHDFLAHRAYQEGFFYGGGYEFPGAGDKISRSRFTIQNEKVVEEELSLVDFDNEWFVSSLDPSSVSGIPLILLSQGRVSRVRIRNLTVRSPEPLWLRASLIYIILFVVFFHLAGTIRRRRIWYGRRRELAVPLAAMYSGDSGIA
jgi:hypothetical protein